MPRTLRTRAQLTEASQPPPAMSSRPRRTATTQQKLRDSSPQATVTVARNSSTSPVDGRNSIRLTVKMPPSKLREATSGSRVKSVGLSSRDSLEPAEVVSGPRSSRAKRSVVIDSGSEDDDDDEDEDDDGEDEEDDAQGEEDEGEEEEEVEEGDEEEGAEEEDEEDEEAEGDEEEEQDAEGESDVEMQDADAPPPPVIQRTGPPSKPRLVVTAPTKEPLESVEAKEMRIANNVDSDEDLSELPDEDAEGEDIVEDDAMIDGEDDAEGDSDEDLSRDGTPDITKLTKRQRGRMGDASDEHFMSLNMEPQTKLHLTDEQRALRRAEMARRRKNLSEKRNEEEKMDTINRLLKKQAPKRRGKISAAEIAAGAETPEVQVGLPEEFEKAEPGFVRWVSNANGCRIGVPIEWKDKAAARVFGNGPWKMIEEVEG